MKIKEVNNGLACVYCLEFPNGLRYVGKTKDLGSRMRLYERFGHSNKYLSAAIDEFGLDSIEVSVLREVGCNDAVDLDLCLSILEIKYIREMGTVYPGGYNVSLGGEVLGIPVEHLTTDAAHIKSYNSGDKCILVYDVEGKFIEEYASIARFAYDKGLDENSVRVAIGRATPFRGKWFLRFKRYDYIPDTIDVPKVEIRERVRYEDTVVKRVIEKDVTIHTYVRALKYDKDGRFCGEYPSKRAACRTFMNSSSSVGWGEYHNGYILFKKVSEDYPMEIEPMSVLAYKQLEDYYVPASELPDKEVKVHSDRSSTPLRVGGKYTNLNNTFKVAQYDLGGNLIKVFDNMRDASCETGIAYSGIWACVNGRVGKCKGYKWSKYEE